MELNAEQIKKALECCGRSGVTPSGVKCDECPYHNNCSFGRNLLIDSLALFLAYEEQIQELTRTCTALTRKVQVLDEQYNSLLDRNVELGDEVEDLKAIAEQYRKQFEEARAGTVREMRDRILEGLGEKEQPISLSFVRWLIDRITQEMLEGK